VKIELIVGVANNQDAMLCAQALYKSLPYFFFLFSLSIRLSVTQRPGIVTCVLKFHVSLMAHVSSLVESGVHSQTSTMGNDSRSGMLRAYLSSVIIKTLVD
jgi:hypothetical protein